jgi:hypothetical protein
MAIEGSVTWAAAIQAGAAVAGFAFIGYQILQLIRNIRGATQDRLYAHYTEICKLFMQKPYLRPYFYENKVLMEGNPDYPHMREEIDVMSEAILGLIEHSTLQQNNLPRDAWKHCWLPYANERLKKSKEIMKFFSPNQTWYTQALRDVIDNYAKTRTTPT